MKHLIQLNISVTMHELTENEGVVHTKPILTDGDSLSLVVENHSNKEVADLVNSVFEEIRKICNVQNQSL